MLLRPICWPLLIPALTGQIVDVLSEGVSKGSVDFAAVGRGALGIAAVAVVSWGLSALQNVMMVKNGPEYGAGFTA